MATILGYHGNIPINPRNLGPRKPRAVRRLSRFITEADPVEDVPPQDIDVLALLGRPVVALQPATAPPEPRNGVEGYSDASDPSSLTQEALRAPTRPPQIRLGEYQPDPENDPHGVRPSSIAGSGGVDVDVLRRSALRNPLADRWWPR